MPMNKKNNEMNVLKEMDGHLTMFMVYIKAVTFVSDFRHAVHICTLVNSSSSLSFLLMFDNATEALLRQVTCDLMMPDACSTMGRRSSIIGQNGKIMHANCQHVCNIDPRYRPRQKSASF